MFTRREILRSAALGAATAIAIAPGVPLAQTDVTPEEARAIAKDTNIWGYALVDDHRILGNSIESGAEPNRLHVPANVPVSAFWSLTLYDTATRSMIQNSGTDSARSGNDNLKVNADGSVDLHLGPSGSAPAGLESNWIETAPGKGFYPFFR